MKRLFPTSLALVLVVGTLGHVFAASFCPGMPGRKCCVTKSASAKPGAQVHQHMHGMAMGTMEHESVPMDGGHMKSMAMDDVGVPPSPLAVNEPAQLSASEEVAPANELGLPIDACTYCMSHSGIQNAPVSSVSVPDQANKDFCSVLLPVSRFLPQPAMTLSQIGLPGEHAPPGSSAPRYILISVFLI